MSGIKGVTDLDRLTQAGYGIQPESEIFNMDKLANTQSAFLRDTTNVNYVVNNLTNRHTQVGAATLAYDDAGNMSQTRRLPTKIDADGVIRVYDPKTNTFGSFNPDGSTKTFFKPTRGVDYWNAQPGSSPWTP